MFSKLMYFVLYLFFFAGVGISILRKVKQYCSEKSNNSAGNQRIIFFLIVYIVIFVCGVANVITHAYYYIMMFFFAFCAVAFMVYRGIQRRL